MRSKFRSALVVFVATLTVGSVASASASASHEFRVEQKSLTGEEKTVGVVGIVHLAQTYGGTEIKYECTKNTEYNGVIKSAGRSKGTLELKSCKVVGMPKCNVSISLIEYGGELVSNTSGGLEDRLGEEGGKALFELSVGGSECAIKETKLQASGYWDCELPEVHIEAVEHELVCKREGNHLKLAGNPFYLEYTNKVKLASGKKWSAE